MSQQYEKRDNSGVLFKNDRKENPNQPDYKGDAMINGVEFWVSAWVKKPKNGGNSFMSFAYKPKEQGAHSSSPRNSVDQPSDSGGFDEQDLPF